VNNEIKVVKKSENDRLLEKIKHLEDTVEKLNLEIRDLKSNNYDLSDTNNKVMKKLKEYRVRNNKSRAQTIEIKEKLKKLYKHKDENIKKMLKEIIKDINED